MIRSVITGTGSALPANCVTNADLAAKVDTSDEWIVERTGIRQRYIADDSQTTSSLATVAARNALDAAGVDAGEIGLIVLATATPDHTFPATATQVQAALGCGGGVAFDVQAVCSGFLYALATADSLLRTGMADKALVIGSETFSRILDWDDRTTCVLFGDGAGAAVIGEGDHSGILAAQFATWPSGYEACTIGSGGTRFDFEKEAELFAANSKFTMDGKELFRLTAKHFGSFVSELLERANTKREDIVRVIAHQASPGALAHMAKICDFREEQVVNIAARFGNQISASIPFTLDYARKTGAVRRGDRIVILGTSAGVSFGGLVMDL